MKKSLFILFAAIMAAIGAKADVTADWKIHMPFDGWPTQVIETPNRVYFLSRTFEKASSIPERAVSSNSLFYYDKAGDEIVSINERVNANGNAVACVGYNDAKKYLMVVYTDCDIDFIYNDGRVFNLPALKVFTVPGKKEVNSITFDVIGKNRAYLATSFGYVAINDSKHEVAESRIYGENVECATLAGDNMVLCVDGKVLYAPASSQRFSLSDYKELTGVPEINAVAPLDEGNFIAYKNSAQTYFGIVRNNEGKYEWEELYTDPRFFGIQQTRDGRGYTLTGNIRLFMIRMNGSVNPTKRLEPEWGMPAATYDKTHIWTLTERKGLRQYSLKDDAWALTKDYMRPNAPATFLSSSFAYHPTYGMLVASNSVDYAFSASGQQTPSNISALKNGFWKEYGPYYSDNPFSKLNNYGGIAIDPQNKNHVYLTSLTGGMMRVNLANPNEVLVFANPNNANSGVNGFIKVADDQQAWKQLCRFSPVQFTSDGTLWTLFNNRNSERAEIWYWPAADRLATTSAANYRPMKKISVPKFSQSNNDMMITLSKNKNIVVMGGVGDGGSVMFYDHNGTPETTADDRYVLMITPHDQDGGGVNFLTVNNLYEDPSTGLVWILSQRGVFTVNPATVFDDPDRVNRIKVARNDGTNLADYLLNEINVTGMTTDGEGRKWFATSNGLVCTSADGRSILGEFLTENSYLPSDAVFSVGYNPENNSLMVATEGGLAEMFPSGSGGSSSDTAGIRAYPNPVEPDFYGWVRIDNIADGSLVKITDAQGGIVKELGPVQGGSVDWDISGLNNSRVSTGVYYIMVSPGSNTPGNTQISKILVLN